MKFFNKQVEQLDVVQSMRERDGFSHPDILVSFIPDVLTSISDTE